MNEKLAIHGGKPAILKEQAKFEWPRITPEVEVAVVTQLHKTISIYDNSGIFGEFEASFASYHGKKYGLLSNSGTSSILAMYEAIGLKIGDEVLCPVYTFHATVSPMMYLGAVPIFCDSDRFGGISLDSIKKHMTDKVKAVIVTHMWGCPDADIEAIADFCKEKGIFLLEDCSHAHGAIINSKKVGSFGDVSAWSLQGQKTITGGEGGILLTDNKEIYDRALIQGHYNKRPKIEIDKNSEYAKYCLTGMGLKLRAHPLAIAMANEQFGQIEEFLTVKGQFATKIIGNLREYDFLQFPQLQEGSRCSWYALPMQFIADKAFDVTKEEFVRALHEEGLIEVDILGSTGLLNREPLFVEPHKVLGRLYEHGLVPQNNFPMAEKYVQQFLKIPVWTFLDEVKIVESYIKGFKKVCDYIVNKHKLEI